MPARNGTGPLGQGPRTGRGMGICKPSRADIAQTSTSANNQLGIGAGRGWGNWLTNLFGRRRSNRINRK